MPSFDVVSELNAHEVSNALDQANKELGQRYDFKNMDASFLRDGNVITLQAPSEFQLTQMLEVLRLKLSKRGIDVGCLQVDEPQSGLSRAQQKVTLREGLDAALSKKIVQLLKNQKLKLQPSIQADKVRVSGKNRDDLQAAIALLKQASFDLPLQYTNFRD